ncbi:MAG TPA: hypothetical protein VF551_04150, partial [Chthoniobacterales bacterium]
MKYTSHLMTGACVAALAFCGLHEASAQSKKSASPSPAASASPAAAASSGDASAKPARAIPFRGTASAIDQSAKTFTIAGKTNSRVFKVTDKTTVTKAGSPATLADLTDNEAVTGSYWKHEDGTLEAKTLKIGGSGNTSKKGKKGDDSADEEG